MTAYVLGLTQAGETFEKHAFDETKNCATYIFTVPKVHSVAKEQENHLLQSPDSKEEIEGDEYAQQNAAALADYDAGIYTHRKENSVG